MRCPYCGTEVITTGRCWACPACGEEGCMVTKEMVINDDTKVSDSD